MKQQKARKWFRMDALLEFLANVSLVLQIIMLSGLVMV
jgi:hypothetical protein